MLDRENKEINNKHGSETTIKRNCQSTYQDLILSLSHRLTVIQNGLHSKIDRTECMLILENKSSHHHLTKLTQELNNKIQNISKIVLEKIAEQQKTNLDMVQKMKEKIKGKKKEKDGKKENHTNQKSMMLVKPQQLYLQSNETMFGMIVDQISNLKQSCQIIQKGLQQRNKVTININNQICEKIEKLQRQIQNKFLHHQKQSVFDESAAQFWTNSDEKSSKIKASSSNFNRTSMSKQTSGESHQFAHLMRSIEALQKDISHKINIKDILPIIRKNTNPLSQMIDQIKNYTEQAIESTKKILVNQSQINQQLSLVAKLAWWHSFEQKDGFAVWNKQIANLIPETFICQKQSNLIIITQQGNYLFKVFSPINELPQSIFVKGKQIQLVGETFIKVDKNVSIQLPSNGNQLLMSIQKI